MLHHLFPSAILLAIVVSPPAYSQKADVTPLKRELITQPVNDQKLVTLHGNTRSAANTANDRGRVSEGLAMDHMLIQLQRPPELEQALEQYTQDLQNPASPNYHQWLTPAQFGQRFGVAQADIDTITNWLESQGFTVNRVYPNQMTIDFSGTAGQVRQAFRTEIHNLDVNGEAHIANMSDPQIPAALAPAVAGIVSLNDFRPHPMKTARTDYTFTTRNGAYQAVVPADLATIYNLNPVFQSGINGHGQTIAVIEDTDVYSVNDWSTFQSKFGLSGSGGSLTTVHPGNCADPGVVAGDDGEAILDAEWASAAAPGAAIQVVSCRNTATTFGGLIALANLLNSGSSLPPPALVSISYGECEAENGAGANAMFNSVYQQAASEGVSVFVSAGDEGAASCDAGGNYATHGVGVSAFASTPYNVAVGGTDFGDTYENANSVYWNSTNTSTFGSAKSYIPEIPWNDSCASSLLASYFGYSTSAGSGGFCNSSTGQNYYLSTAAGSGGPSNCATGTPATTGIASGNCAGYAKPSWQAGLFGNPSDGVRDIPDVSLFAANGVWGHYYVYCWTDIRNGGASCSGAPSKWSGAGGTSFSSPIMAGIQALVNQNQANINKNDGRQGNPNHVYYALAAAEYGTNGNNTCLSNNGNGVGSSCAFYDVTNGDMDVVCAGTTACYGSTTTTGGFGFRFGRQYTSTTYGVLSVSSGSLIPAFGTAPGWDFATGLGTVNAQYLVTQWNSVTPRQ